MAKYNVGVGDAFPVDADDRRADESVENMGDDDRRPWRRRYRHYHRRPGIFFRLAFVLFVIWGALSIFAHHAPHGLLVAAGVLLAISLVFGALRSDDEWRARREARRARLDERRDERRRYWGDR